MLGNYISLHFNQILSSLKLAFPPPPPPFLPYVMVPNCNPRSEKLKVFSSMQGCPSAASILLCWFVPQHYKQLFCMQNDGLI